MSLFKKHLKIQANLVKKAEDEAAEEKEMEKEAADESAEESTEDKKEDTMEKEADVMDLGGVEDTTMTAEDEAMSADPALQEIGDAVEEYVQQVVEEVQGELIQANHRAEVNSAVINQLRYHGILVANPYKNLKPTKFSNTELSFIKTTTKAAVEAVEEVLRASAKALQKRSYGGKQASFLDRRYQNNGFLRSCVAKPELRPEARKAAMEAAKKTRKSNVLGLE